MAIFDIIVLAVAIFAGIKGFRRGFVVEVITTLAFFIGLFLALKLTFPIAIKFFGDLEIFWLIALVIFLILLFLVMWGAKALAKSIRKGIEESSAGVVDSIFGVAVAILKWAFTLSVILWVMQSLDVSMPSSWTNKSYALDPISTIAPTVFDFFGRFMPFFQDILDNMEASPRRV